MIKNVIYILSIVLLATGINSCSTDFDVIGDYEEATIVYGLLDQSEDMHFIKINKSFLGPGNAYTYASVRDSSEYQVLDAKIEEWVNGSKTREWPLRDTVLSDRENGIFYGPEYTAYYFVEPNLIGDASTEYRLIININDGEKEVTSSTKLIEPFLFNYPPNTSPNTTIGFATFNTIDQTTTYNPYTIKWISAPNGKRYDLSIRFKWDEMTATDTTRKYLDWFVGTEIMDDQTILTGGIEVVKLANGESFYNNIANKLAPDPNVIKRVVKGVDIMVSSASDDMFTYMIVNAPSSGLIQERPQFTNVTNGVGIFSARYNQSILNKKLSKGALEVLCNGALTGHLGFCSDTIIYSAESFYCQ